MKDKNATKKPKIGRQQLTAVLTVAFVLTIAAGAFGGSSYLTQFNSRYSTSTTVLNSCALCHPAGGGNSAGNVNNYARDYANNSHNFATIETLDSDGDGYLNLAEITARTWPGDSTSHPGGDTTLPVVGTFTIPTTSSSLVVPISTFTATDNVLVTGYMVTETATTKPAATATGWTTSPPTSYTFATAGSKTLYGWAKDAAGNVSNGVSDTVVITLSDATLPVVGTFTIPTTSSSLVVPISTFTATDNVLVTGYMVTETATTKPAATATGWTTSPPTSYTFATAGSKTLYGWAKDAAGNVSNGVSDTVVITLPADVTPPNVTAFTLPAISNSLTVTITTFTATDNAAVTGYLVTETSTKPAASATGWTATPPASYIFATAGSKTLYAWAQDAAGNVSTGIVSGTVTIQATDMTPPVISNFMLPTLSLALNVPIIIFTATDDMGVTGYMLTETVDQPLATATGWSAAPPTTYTFDSAGVKALYAWAKDAAGNVSDPWSDMVTVELSDAIPPDVMEFTLPYTTDSLIVPIIRLIAIDDIGVTGYMVTETPAAPAATATGWSAAPPSRYTFTTAGTKTLYAWAKDAAGNVSNSLTDTVVITITDRTPPVVTAFSIPRTSSTLTIPIQRFTATDNKVVAGYMVTTTSTIPAWSSPNWSATPPATYTFTTAGSKRLYPWARDAAGNVSSIYGSAVRVTITLNNGNESDD